MLRDTDMSDERPLGSADDLLPDEILDKHFGGGGTATATEDNPPDPASEGTDDDHDDSLEDMPDDGPESEIEDDDELEDGDEELEEELEDDDDYDLDDEELEEEELDEEEDEEGLDDEEEDDEDDDEADEEEDVLEGQVTSEDHERIKKDPSLKRVHKEMQRAFTKKTQAVSERDREVNAREERIENFTKSVSTPKGMADYVARTLKERPDIIGAAFEQVATEAGLDFLIEVGLHDSELFEEAYNRVRDLEADPDERASHDRDREMRRRDSELSAREQRIRRRTFDKAVSRVETMAEAEAKKLKIEPDEMDHVNSRLKLKIRERTGEDGSVNISKDEVREIATEARAELDRIYDRAKRRLDHKRSKESRKAAKKKAKRTKTKKRVPPRSRGEKPPRQHGKFKPPEGADPLDAFIDHRLSEI